MLYTRALSRLHSVGGGAPVILVGKNSSEDFAFAPYVLHLIEAFPSSILKTPPQYLGLPSPTNIFDKYTSVLGRTT